MLSGVPLIGVCPEHEITYPKLQTEKRSETEVTNGHTHVVVLGNKTRSFEWGEESELKIELAKRIAKGHTEPKKYWWQKDFSCKIVTVLVGDNPYCEEDIFAAYRSQIPVVVLEGSRLSNDVFALRAGQRDVYMKSQDLAAYMTSEKVFSCKDSAEDAASIVHLFLSIGL